jgi:hypothetical protein
MAKGGNVAPPRVPGERLRRRCALAAQAIDRSTRACAGFTAWRSITKQMRRRLAQLNRVQAHQPTLARAWVLPLLAAFAAGWAVPA